MRPSGDDGLDGFDLLRLDLLKDIDHIELCGTAFVEVKHERCIFPPGFPVPWPLSTGLLVKDHWDASKEQ